MPKKRNYKKEYRDYHSKPEQIARRQARNYLRNKMMKLGLVHVGDGRAVMHLDRDPANLDFDQKVIVLLDEAKGNRRSKNEKG